MLLLIFIYYFKSFLSISDIEKLLHPLIEKYFKGEEGHNIAFIYDQISQMERDSSEKMKSDLSDYISKCRGLFCDAEPEDQDSLRQFALVCLLAYDVYCKKCLIEKLIDEQE